MTRNMKLTAGGLLLLLGLVFAVQNSAVVEVRIVAWSIQMSQALVIFVTGAAGLIAGFFLGTAYRITRQT